ncbi:MAG: hypothetical protein AAF253_14035, partial [Pseudomonadota bacterium]
MSNESAVYEDDLDFDFDDDPDLELALDEDEIFESDGAVATGDNLANDMTGDREPESVPDHTPDLAPDLASDLAPDVEVDLNPVMKDVVFDDSAFEINDPTQGMRPIPAISIMAFIEKPSTQEMLETVSRDRRMGRATLDVHDGGLPAAIEYLSANQSPNLLIVESGISAPEMIEQIDRLAEHCDEGVEVMVIGATNDIKLYRQLTARGVSGEAQRLLAHLH